MNKQLCIYFKQRFDKDMIQISHSPLSKKPELLLHACCAPCSSYVLEYLTDYFDITIYFYNPNIHPKTEYERRLEELRQFLETFPKAVQNKIKLIVTPYDPEEYFNATKTREDISLQTESERGERCRRCYLMRIKKTFDYAQSHQYPWVTTTLSISPYKDAEKINQIGTEIEEQQKELSSFSPRFLSANFKKNNGFLRSLEISKEFSLYRQNYCGCIYSLQNQSEK